MPSFTRVEFSLYPSLRSLRIVLLTNSRTKYYRKLRREKTNSEVEACRIALEAIRALHFGSVRSGMTFISSTPGKIKNPSRLANLIILPKTAAARGSSKSLEAIADPHWTSPSQGRLPCFIEARVDLGIWFAPVRSAVDRQVRPSSMVI